MRTTAGQVERDVGDGLRQDGPQADVVPVEGHVQAAYGYVDALDAPERLGQPPGEGHAPRLQPDEDDPVEAVVVLDDLVGDAGDGPADVLGVHDPGPGNENAPVRGRCGSFALGQA